MPRQVAQNRPASLPGMDSLPPVSRMLVALGYGLASWQARQRSRRALSRLDNRILRDIGLDAELRDIEIAKPFWRA